MKRDANIELLRIVSMILIIAGHLVEQNNVIEKINGISLFTALLLGSAYRIAVNIFLLIGVWFMVNKEFSARRIIVLYGEVWFYGIFLTGIVIFGGGDLTPLGILRVVFPFSLRGAWFASSYIALLLIAPFLKLIIDGLKKDIAFKFIFVLFCLICVMDFFNKCQDHWIDNLAWFSFIYLAVGIYKKFCCGDKLKYHYRIIGLIGLLCYIFMVIMIYMCCKRQGAVWKGIYSIFNRGVFDIKSLPNILCAVSLFVYFKNINIRYGINKINFCAKHAFSVYIIHQTGTFIRYMWDRIFRCTEWIQSPYFIFFYIITVNVIYFGCMPVDWLRRRFVEPVFINSRLFKAVEKKIDSFYRWSE